MPTRLTAFSDGVVQICRLKDRKTEFGARRNATTADDLEPVVKLTFSLASKRQQDLEFAEQSGFQLALKIRTRKVPEVEAKMKAVIDGYLYDIAYVDKVEREMFVYLESVRRLATTGGGSDA